MLRATGKQNERTVELALNPGTRTLWFRNELDLWDTEKLASEDECYRAAEQKFGVTRGAWTPGEFTLTDMIQAYAMDAWVMARDRFGMTLDFSADAAKKVEIILGKISDQRPTGIRKLLMGKQYEASLADLAKAWGSYLGEIMRRQLGGQWDYADELYPGKQIIALKWDEGNMCFPPAKVHKRLSNGPEDNVASFYAVMAQKRREKAPSD